MNTPEVILVLAQASLLAQTVVLAVSPATKAKRWSSGPIVVGLLVQALALGALGLYGAGACTVLNAACWAWIYVRRAV